MAQEEKIKEVVVEGLDHKVEGLDHKLYCASSDLDLLGKALKKPDLKARYEIIAPLDNMLWDRKLIKALFGFDYKWEIYTPKERRKYGCYTIPLLYGDRFIGRMEAACDRKTKTLIVKNI